MVFLKSYFKRYIIDIYKEKGDSMEFVKWMDELPFIGKLLLSLPIVDLTWAIYRIIKGVHNKNNGLLIVGILWVVFGSYALWLVDFITTIILGKPVLTDNLE